MVEIGPGTILGQYEVQEPLGVGGMARVFKAYHASLDRHVAVKVLPVQYASDEMFLERFRQEARTVARLRHPNILEVYDFGEYEGVPFIVMEYMDGGTLASWLTGPRGLEAAVSVIGQTAAGLDYAHDRGILHRDIKPSNIFINSDGIAILGDFGLAKIMEAAKNLTVAGTVLGTPEFMSPEQALGRPVDRRSDVYSLGVVLYTLLTGQLPYSSGTALATMYAHVQEPLPPPRTRNPDLLESVEAVVMKSLAKAPEERYGTAGELALALAAAGSPAAMEPASGTYQWPTLVTPPPSAPVVLPTAAHPGETIAGLPTAAGVSPLGSAPPASPPVTPPPVEAAPAVSPEVTPPPVAAAPPVSPEVTTPPVVADVSPLGASPETAPPPVIAEPTQPLAAPAAARGATVVTAPARPAWLIPAVIGGVILIGAVVAIVATAGGRGATGPTAPPVATIAVPALPPAFSEPAAAPPEGMGLEPSAAEAPGVSVPEPPAAVEVAEPEPAAVEPVAPPAPAAPAPVLPRATTVPRPAAPAPPVAQPEPQAPAAPVAPGAAPMGSEPGAPAPQTVPQPAPPAQSVPQPAQPAAPAAPMGAPTPSGGSAPAPDSRQASEIEVAPAVQSAPGGSAPVAPMGAPIAPMGAPPPTAAP